MQTPCSIITFCGVTELISTFSTWLGNKKCVAHFSVASKALRERIMPSGLLPIQDLMLDSLSEDYIRTDERDRQFVHDPNGELAYLIRHGRRVPHYRTLFFRLEEKLDLRLLKTIEVSHHGETDSHRFQFAEALRAILRAMLAAGLRLDTLNLKGKINICDAFLAIDCLANKGKLRLWDQGVFYNDGLSLSDLSADDRRQYQKQFLQKALDKNLDALEAHFDGGAFIYISWSSSISSWDTFFVGQGVPPASTFVQKNMFRNRLRRLASISDQWLASKLFTNIKIRGRPHDPWS